MFDTKTYLNYEKLNVVYIINIEVMIENTVNKRKLIIQILINLVILIVTLLLSQYKYFEWFNAHKLKDNVMCAIFFISLLLLLNFKVIYWILSKEYLLSIIFFICAAFVVIGVIGVASQYTNGMDNSPKLAIIISNITNISTIFISICLETLITIKKLKAKS